MSLTPLVNVICHISLYLSGDLNNRLLYLQTTSAFNIHTSLQDTSKCEKPVALYLNDKSVSIQDEPLETGWDRGES